MSDHGYVRPILQRPWAALHKAWVLVMRFDYSGHDQRGQPGSVAAVDWVRRCAQAALAA